MDKVARFGIVAVALAACTSLAPLSVHAQTSQWVQRGETGRLIYTPDAQGDRVMDFTGAGYMGQGSAAIPNNIQNVIVLSPVAGDDTTQIQNAINTLAAMPIGADGYRGAILLQAGTYDIYSQLNINASGIVLRGEGREGSGTILHGRTVGAEGMNQRPLIRIEGNGSQSLIGSTYNMIDKTVPVGATSFRINSASAFSVGDTIRIERPSTQEWIDDIGMGDPIGEDPAWVPNTMNLRYERTITRIEGDRIFIDAPLANSFEQQYGGGTVKKYTWSGVVENVGIENLRGDSDYDSPTDEDHAWEFIFIGGTSLTADRAMNVWVRDIAAVHFGDSTVVANPSSKYVTVDNAISYSPISIITGGRRYTYDLSGSYGYVTNCSADSGRHDFVNNSTRPAGPNVFYDCTATNSNSDSGPHQRWATGTLFDNISYQGTDGINVRNRETLGTRHGWSGANMVIWNSQADSFIVQNPPTAQNWLIGSTGTIVEDTEFGPQPSGYYDSHGTAIEDIPSLYESQVADSDDVNTYHWSGGDGNWQDTQGWYERATPLARSVEVREYLVGDIDDYVNDGSSSVDNTYVDPDFEAEILGSSANPITGFDDLAGNQNVAFTQQFVLDPGDVVVHGWMAMALKGTGGLVDTDFVKIDGAGQMSYAAMGWDTQVNTTDTFVGMIDLGTDTLLPILNNDSQLSVNINDDTGVDWAIVAITVLTDKGAGAADVILDAGGTITVDSAVDAVNSISISNSTLRLEPTADLDVLADLDTHGSAVLAFGIDNTGASLLDVAADADLTDATIDLDLLDGYLPAANQTFDLLTGASIIGTPTIDGDDLAMWELSVVAGGNGEVLRATFIDALAGDLNGDGFVGLDDLDIVLNHWNQNVTPGSLADGDPSNDGFVGLDDLDIILSNWNAGTPSNNNATIPEPATIMICLTVGLPLLRRR